MSGFTDVFYKDSKERCGIYGGSVLQWQTQHAGQIHPVQAS
jgi:hypothetical protein